MKKGRFVSEYCKHDMRICPKCGATFCKGECKSWTETGPVSYASGNALSRHKNHVPYEEIKEQELCEFCKKEGAKPDFIKRFQEEFNCTIQVWNTDKGKKVGIRKGDKYLVLE